MTFRKVTTELSNIDTILIHFRDGEGERLTVAIDEDAAVELLEAVEEGLKAYRSVVKKCASCGEALPEKCYAVEFAIIDEANEINYGFNKKRYCSSKCLTNTWTGKV